MILLLFYYGALLKKTNGDANLLITNSQLYDFLVEINENTNKKYSEFLTSHYVNFKDNSINDEAKIDFKKFIKFLGEFAQKIETPDLLMRTEVLLTSPISNVLTSNKEQIGWNVAHISVLSSYMTQRIYAYNHTDGELNEKDILGQDVASLANLLSFFKHPDSSPSDSSNVENVYQLRNKFGTNQLLQNRENNLKILKILCNLSSFIRALFFRDDFTSHKLYDAYIYSTLFTPVIDEILTFNSIPRQIISKVNLSVYLLLTGIRFIEFPTSTIADLILFYIPIFNPNRNYTEFSYYMQIISLIASITFLSVCTVNSVNAIMIQDTATAINNIILGAPLLLDVIDRTYKYYTNDIGEKIKNSYVEKIAGEIKKLEFVESSVS